MFIDRKQLAEMIAQEVRFRLRELAEADDDAEGGDGAKRKRPRKPATADAEDSPSPKGEGPGGPTVDPDRDTGSGPVPADPNSPDDGEEDPEQDPDASAAIDADGDAGEDPTGAINNEIAGKAIQAITIEPQSKILPGAKEVVITFGDSSDALRILITKAGHGDEGPPVKFFWRGHLHDLP